MSSNTRDHGGGLDKAMAQFGGTRDNWIDLSTGINPNPYPLPEIPAHHWHVLPDAAARDSLLEAARNFWNVPAGANIVPASGVSAIIAMLPTLAKKSQVSILNPTYNEFAASFSDHKWPVSDQAPVQVRVHPNNPDGRLFSRAEIEHQHDQLTIIDESFCDVCPKSSLIDLAQRPNHIVLKGLGKFWGLAGLRLGFAIATPDLVQKISQQLGPWNVSGPAQFIGQMALSDKTWAQNTRVELAHMTTRLQNILARNELTVLGGTDLFQLAETKDAKTLHKHLCQNHILTRIFPYTKKWIRLGLPANETELSRLDKALGRY